jgi:hypothetical protein
MNRRISNPVIRFGFILALFIIFGSSLKAIAQQDDSAVRRSGLILKQISIIPKQPYLNQDVTIRGIIVNSGIEPVDSMLILSTMNALEIGRHFIPSLRGGEETEFSFVWHAETNGYNDLRVGLGKMDEVLEMGEQNILARHLLFVAKRTERLPDLCIAEFHLFPEKPAPEEEVMIEGVIENRGDGAAENATAYWRIDDGREVHVKRDQIEVLDAGGRSHISNQFIAPPSGELAEILFSIDPDDQIEEKDKSNNLFSFTFSTEWPETVPPPVITGDAFEEEDARGWELSGSWRTEKILGNGLLRCEGAGIARFKAGESWDDYAFKCRLNLLEGAVNIWYRESDNGKYVIGVEDGGISLNKVNRAGEFIFMTRSEAPISRGTWHDIKITGEDEIIRIFLDQELIITYEDETPLLNGGIAFESKENTFVHFDNTQLTGSTVFPDLVLYQSGYTIPSLPQQSGVYPWPPLTDRPTLFEVALTNKGLPPVEGSCITEMYLDGNFVKMWPFPSAAETFDLGPHAKITIESGGSRLYSHQVLLSEGVHNLSWIADAGNTIRETYENNNKLDVSVFCQKPPDLIVENVWPKGTAYGGQKSVWNIRVKNIGQGDVKIPFLTTFWPEGITAGAQENYWTQSLAAGQSVTYQTTQSFHSWGQLNTKVEVDVGNYVPEVLPNGENNNKFEKLFNLDPVDLQVHDLVISPQNPTCYTQLNISFKISNIGNGDALSPFKVKVMPGKVTNNLLQYSLLTVNSLKSGQTISLNHTVQLPEGKHTVSVEADCFAPNAVYFEPNRNNNTATQQITVKGPFTGLTNVLGPSSKLAMNLGESIFVDPSKPAEVARDKDGDWLKDDLENRLANGFRPYYKFDSAENALRYGEPVTLFQVRPQGYVGTGNKSKTKLLIRWGFLYMWDGGYGPDSWCSDVHMGDNVTTTYTFESTDNGSTWVITSISIGGFSWPGGIFRPAYLGKRVVVPYKTINVELYNQHHPVIYMSAHKHHMYFNTAYDHKDSFYSKWKCNEDVNGKGKAFISDLRSVFKDSRYNNVGEPENHPVNIFVNCMPQFPATVIVSGIKRVVDTGNFECYNCFNQKGHWYSAWGTSHFYEEHGNADLWLKSSECKFWK